MDYTLTLVASDTPLNAAHIEQVEAFLQKIGILETAKPTWLTRHKACDISISNALNMTQMIALRDLCAPDKIDVFCVRTYTRRKSLLMADMDSTIVTSETLDELAHEAGIKDKIAAITERAMRGELDFHDALRERVGLLKGLSTKSLIVTLEATKISQGARELVRNMRDNGAFCALVSGGFTYFTAAIAKNLGFNVHHGNILDIDGDVLSGTVTPPILDKDSKLEFLHQYCAQQEIALSDSVAIGDGANDLPMLQAAGLGIGYHPKPLLETSLLNCIRFGDLTAVLYVQGYKL